MNKGGTVDFGWVQVTMVNADHSSGCPGKDNCIIPGGAAAGFVVRFNNHSVYHSGDTNVFGDMAIIDELYKPDISLLCIGGHFTMGPDETGYALAKFLTSTKIVFPMHFLTFPLLKGDPKQLREACKKWGAKDVKIVESYDLIGKATAFDAL